MSDNNNQGRGRGRGGGRGRDGRGGRGRGGRGRGGRRPREPNAGRGRAITARIPVGSGPLMTQWLQDTSRTIDVAPSATRLLAVQAAIPLLDEFEPGRPPQRPPLEDPNSPIRRVMYYIPREVGPGVYIMDELRSCLPKADWQPGAIVTLEELLFFPQTKIYKETIGNTPDENVSNEKVKSLRLIMMGTRVSGHPAMLERGVKYNTMKYAFTEFAKFANLRAYIESDVTVQNVSIAQLQVIFQAFIALDRGNTPLDNNQGASGDLAPYVYDLPDKEVLTPKGQWKKAQELLNQHRNAIIPIARGVADAVRQGTEAANAARARNAIRNDPNVDDDEGLSNFDHEQDDAGEPLGAFFFLSDGEGGAVGAGDETNNKTPNEDAYDGVRPCFGDGTKTTGEEETDEGGFDGDTGGHAFEDEGTSGGVGLKNADETRRKRNDEGNNATNHGVGDAVDFAGEVEEIEKEKASAASFEFDGDNLSGDIGEESTVLNKEEEPASNEEQVGGNGRVGGSRSTSELEGQGEEEAGEKEVGSPGTKSTDRLGSGIPSPTTGYQPKPDQYFAKDKNEDNVSSRDSNNGTVEENPDGAEQLSSSQLQQILQQRPTGSDDKQQNGDEGHNGGMESTVEATFGRTYRSPSKSVPKTAGAGDNEEDTDGGQLSGGNGSPARMEQESMDKDTNQQGSPGEEGTIVSTRTESTDGLGGNFELPSPTFLAVVEKFWDDKNEGGVSSHGSTVVSNEEQVGGNGRVGGSRSRSELEGQDKDVAEEERSGDQVTTVPIGVKRCNGTTASIEGEPVKLGQAKPIVPKGSLVPSEEEEVGNDESIASMGYNDSKASIGRKESTAKIDEDVSPPSMAANVAAEEVGLDKGEYTGAGEAGGNLVDGPNADPRVAAADTNMDDEEAKAKAASVLHQRSDFNPQASNASTSEFSSLQGAGITILGEHGSTGSRTRVFQKAFHATDGTDSLAYSLTPPAGRGHQGQPHSGRLTQTGRKQWARSRGLALDRPADPEEADAHVQNLFKRRLVGGLPVDEVAELDIESPDRLSVGAIQDANTPAHSVREVLTGGDTDDVSQITMDVHFQRTPAEDEHTQSTGSSMERPGRSYFGIKPAREMKEDKEERERQNEAMGITMVPLRPRQGTPQLQRHDGGNKAASPCFEPDLESPGVAAEGAAERVLDDDDAPANHQGATELDSGGPQDSWDGLSQLRERRRVTDGKPGAGSGRSQFAAKKDNASEASNDGPARVEERQAVQQPEANSNGNNGSRFQPSGSYAPPPPRKYLNFGNDGAIRMGRLGPMYNVPSQLEKGKGADAKDHLSPPSQNEHLLGTPQPQGHGGGNNDVSPRQDVDLESPSPDAKGAPNQTLQPSHNHEVAVALAFGAPEESPVGSQQGQLRRRRRRHRGKSGIGSPVSLAAAAKDNASKLWPVFCCCCKLSCCLLLFIFFFFWAMWMMGKVWLGPSWD